MERTAENSRRNKTIILSFNVSTNVQLKSLIDGAKEIEDCLTYILGTNYLGNLCFEEVSDENHN